MEIQNTATLPNRKGRGLLFFICAARRKIDGRTNNGGHKPKGEPRVPITPRVLTETAEKLRSIAEREKISIGKVIDAWAKLHD